MWYEEDLRMPGVLEYPEQGSNGMVAKNDKNSSH